MDRGRPKRLRGADLFLFFANVGLVSFSFMALVYVLEVQVRALLYANALAGLLVAVSLLGLFLTRRSDEYVEALWNSATSAAFAGLVLGMIATQVGFGLIGGHATATREVSDQLHSIPLTLPFLAFFLVLSLQRLRRPR